jgi:hypothetical protein
VIEFPQSLILLTCSDTATFPLVWIYLVFDVVLVNAQAALIVSSRDGGSGSCYICDRNAFSALPAPRKVLSEITPITRPLLSTTGSRRTCLSRAKASAILISSLGWQTFIPGAIASETGIADSILSCV